MNLPRRRFLQLSAGAVALPAVSHFGWANTYPVRPVRIIVGLAAGGANDILARMMGQWLSERLGQPFVVENRPGAGGNTATEAVVRSAPDGHTLLLAGGNNAINATLYDKLNFDFIRDIAAVASIGTLPNILVVNPSVPAKNVPDLIAYVRANASKVNMASAGTGTASHMAGELFKMMTGVAMAHVPYRGGAPAITELIAGQVQVMFIGPAVSIEHVRSGKLRGLAATTAARWELVPDLPTVGDSVPGYESGNYFGIGAPRNTPPEIINKLNKEINAAFVDPKIRARIADLGGTVIAGSPADFGRLIAAESEKWGRW